MPGGFAVAGAASPWQASVSTVASNFHALTVRSMNTFMSVSSCGEGGGRRRRQNGHETRQLSVSVNVHGFSSFDPPCNLLFVLFPLLFLSSAPLAHTLHYE